jgi:AcrR family transcriptional regulator
MDVAIMELTFIKPPRRHVEPALLAKPGHSKIKPERKRDRAAKQQALMQAAKMLFARRGYEATTTREIAACAGCAEGLIHRYFNGKAGLFLAVIQYRISQEVADLSDRLPLAGKFEDEVARLVDWEIDRMWEDREFLKVIIPRALLDPAVGKVLLQVATSRSTPVIVERLRRFKDYAHAETEALEAYARLIDLLGFTFGFLQPVLMGQDHAEAKKSAMRLVRTLVRQTQSAA